MLVKVFIVDDHYMVVEGIRSLLSNENMIEWSGHAMNAASCMAFLNQQQPDVILMDINLPDLSGIELCAKVKEKYPGIFILGLSTFNQISYIQKMIDNGASGYVLKNATGEELIEAIMTVVSGKQYLSHAAAQNLRKQQIKDVIITRREKEVLELIAEGLTNVEIANQLFISDTTVETHRRNLLAKFNVRNVASLVKTAMKMHILGD
jgi:DNA-binding NarL/FixJ family response regulator